MRAAAKSNPPFPLRARLIYSYSALVCMIIETNRLPGVVDGVKLFVSIHCVPEKHRKQCKVIYPTPQFIHSRSMMGRKGSLPKYSKNSEHYYVVYNVVAGGTL